VNGEEAAGVLLAHGKDAKDAEACAQARWRVLTSRPARMTMR
jgi:hypothetical protein